MPPRDILPAGRDMVLTVPIWQIAAHNAARTLPQFLPLPSTLQMVRVSVPPRTSLLLA